MIICVFKEIYNGSTTHCNTGSFYKQRRVLNYKFIFLTQCLNSENLHAKSKFF